MIDPIDKPFKDCTTYMVEKPRKWWRLFSVEMEFVNGEELKDHDKAQVTEREVSKQRRRRIIRYLINAVCYLILGFAVSVIMSCLLLLIVTNGKLPIEALTPMCCLGSLQITVFAMMLYDGKGLIELLVYYRNSH